ncbi:RNA-binding domain-containing protein, partial [Methanoculleus sp.]|uniref:RNA-binding domain-containing protein n=1 Tax=Methanoculleus sp. TaxID=90427 RepID=UPI002CB87E41
FAYYAALVLLDAPALFSSTRVGDLLDPAIHAARSTVEQHHLYPKAHLATLNITDTREINQIANYAYVEWGDNNKIADRGPADYLPQLKIRFTRPELANMYHYHALPENWEQLDYHTFLEQRRELMAQIIREGYQRLVVGNELKPEAEAFDLSLTIDYGESESVEFKATLRTNLHTGATDTRMEMSVLKTLAGFLNTGGGTLVIGVLDDGTPLGLGSDGFPSEDKMSLHLVNIVKARISPQALTTMHMHFEDYDGERVMVVRCQKSPVAVFVKDGEHERFYVRTGPSTTELKASETQDYIKQRFDR